MMRKISNNGKRRSTGSFSKRKPMQICLYQYRVYDQQWSSTPTRYRLPVFGVNVDIGVRLLYCISSCFKCSQVFAVQSNVALLYEILKFSKYLVDITKSRVQNGFVGQVNDSSQMDLAMRMRWAKIMVSMSMTTLKISNRVCLRGYAVNRRMSTELCSSA